MVKSSQAPPACTGSHEWVDATPFRAHLRHLADGDLTSAQAIAVLAGVSPRVTRRLLTGDGSVPLRRISPDTARRLYAVTPAVLAESRRRMVPALAVGASMAALSWPAGRWARLLQIPEAEVTRIQRREAPACSLWTAVRVRVAVTAAGRALRSVEGIPSVAPARSAQPVLGHAA